MKLHSKDYLRRTTMIPLDIHKSTFPVYFELTQQEIIQLKEEAKDFPTQCLSKNYLIDYSMNYFWLCFSQKLERGSCFICR